VNTVLDLLVLRKQILGCAELRLITSGMWYISLYLIAHHTKKTIGEWRYNSLHSQPLGWVGVTDRLYAPYLSRPQCWSGNGDGESLCPFLGIETQFLGPSLRSTATVAACIVRGFRNARNVDV